MDALRQAEPRASAPFDAHVTLLSGLAPAPDDKSGVEALWKTTCEAIDEWRKEHGKGPIEAGLKACTTRGAFFQVCSITGPGWKAADQRSLSPQCVLLALQEEASLLALNAAMRSALGKQDQPPFFPHASLLYAPLSAAEAEERIEQLRKDGVWSTQGDGIEFGSEKLKTLSLGRVELWDTNGQVQEWKCLCGTDL
jgi:hypothetical protein